jgi:hypothetical protein
MASEKSSSEVPPIISRSSGSLAGSALDSKSLCFAAGLVQHPIAVFTLLKFNLPSFEFGFAKLDMNDLFDFSQSSLLAGIHLPHGQQ